MLFSGLYRDVRKFRHGKTVKHSLLTLRQPIFLYAHKQDKINVPGNNMANNIKLNTPDYEIQPLVAPSGFREYDARWLWGSQLNARGVILLGQAIGNMACEKHGPGCGVVVGHDYRSYSSEVKHALVIGLMAAGCHVHDIGLCVSPMAYFAQFELDVPAVAMVTASHNENGWTGIKMGIDRPLTFGPEEMSLLKTRVLSGDIKNGTGGQYTYHQGMREKYIADAAKDGAIKRPLRVVVGCRNGTAGLVAPDALRAIGCTVIEQDCTLDYTFPNGNPNPEDLSMLHALADAVRTHSADIGIGFDGDGDRVGVVDHQGHEIFADKMGVLLARDLAAIHPGAVFVADVKSTGLYHTDPVLKSLNARTDYWITGHSYIKRRSNQIGALAGFEKSGHFFFGAPYGRGYDDALVSAIAVCRMLDRKAGQTLKDIYDTLPTTWLSPTMQPECADEVKYAVVDRLRAKIEAMHKGEIPLKGHKVVDINTVNGVRFMVEDGSWGLVRASSNKPVLSIVVESPVSESRMKDMFAFIDETFAAEFPEIGAYDQKLPL